MSGRKMIKDDFVFKPYETMGGWQCKIETSKGTLSIRYGGRGLLVEPDKPYEVWYPDEDAPTPRQTSEEIWDYIKLNPRQGKHF